MLNKILVTGASGQLGSELKKITGDDVNFFYTDINELDILDRDKLDNFIVENSISVVVNCAAYTAVDKAETEKEKAAQVNIDACKNLADMCSKHDAKLIHISTDFVFDGTNFRPYREDCETRPLSVYGETKLGGEKAIVSTDANAIIIRTSWLYSSFGNNFVKTIMRLAREREKLGVIFDQVGTPTYAGDLAECILEIIDSNETKNGIYHFSNEGAASWYDFAKSIIDISGIDCCVNPIPAKEYPTPAKRPFYSVLDKTKIKRDFSVNIPYWRDSLVKCIKEINK